MRRHASSPVMGRVIAFEQERFVPLHMREIVPSMFRVEMDREDFAAPMRINQSINHEIRRIDTPRVAQPERRLLYRPRNRTPYVDNRESMLEQLIRLFRKKITHPL